MRVALPLLALAGVRVPATPRYDYRGLTGDATGFYAAAREFISAWGRLAPTVLVGLAVLAVAGTAYVVRAWRPRRSERPWLIAGAAGGVALLASAAVTEMEPPGAAVFGWPLVWSIPLFPLRAFGVLDADVAFGVGLALSLAANVVTVFATFFAAVYATGRRAVGLVAAALFALWPLLMRLAGTHAWDNGTWNVDTGLALYTEPISTALVTTALALLLSPRVTDERLALAGVALSLATAVRLSNALVALGVLILVAIRLDPRRSLPYLAGALSFVPLVLAYWPKGYEDVGREPFSLAYVDDAWTDSILFTPQLLAVLVPLALVGALAVRDWWPRALLALFALANVALYSFYRVTEIHPRFLFASLPAAFVLCAVSLTALAGDRQPSRRRGRAGSRAAAPDAP